MGARNNSQVVSVGCDGLDEIEAPLVVGIAVAQMVRHKDEVSVIRPVGKRLVKALGAVEGNRHGSGRAVDRRDVVNLLEQNGRIRHDHGNLYMAVGLRTPVERHIGRRDEVAQVRSVGILVKHGMEDPVADWPVGLGVNSRGGQRSVRANNPGRNGEADEG